MVVIGGGIQGDHLDGGKPLGGAVGEVIVHVRTVELDRHLPSGVGEVEEGRAIGLHEVAAVGRNPKGTGGTGNGRGRNGGRRGNGSGRGIQVRLRHDLAPLGGAVPPKLCKRATICVEILKLDGVFRTGLKRDVAPFDLRGMPVPVVDDQLAVDPEPYAIVGDG